MKNDLKQYKKKNKSKIINGLFFITLSIITTTTFIMILTKAKTKENTKLYNTEYHTEAFVIQKYENKSTINNKHYLKLRLNDDRIIVKEVSVENYVKVDEDNIVYIIINKYKEITNIYNDYKNLEKYIENIEKEGNKEIKILEKKDYRLLE